MDWEVEEVLQLRSDSALSHGGIVPVHIRLPERRTHWLLRRVRHHGHQGLLHHSLEAGLLVDHEVCQLLLSDGGFQV